MKQSKATILLKPVLWVLAPVIGFISIVCALAFMFGVLVLCGLGEKVSQHNTGPTPVL